MKLTVDDTEVPLMTIGTILVVVLVVVLIFILLGR